jgi:hypothetical protein
MRSLPDGAVESQIAIWCRLSYYLGSQLPEVLHDYLAVTLQLPDKDDDASKIE